MVDETCYSRPIHTRPLLQNMSELRCEVFLNGLEWMALMIGKAYVAHERIINTA